MQWSTGCLRLLLCGAGLQVLLSSSVLCWQWDTGGGSTGWWCEEVSLPPLPPTMRCLHTPQPATPTYHHTDTTIFSRNNWLEQGIDLWRWDGEFYSKLDQDQYYAGLERSVRADWLCEKCQILHWHRRQSWSHGQVGIETSRQQNSFILTPSQTSPDILYTFTIFSWEQLQLNIFFFNETCEFFTLINDYRFLLWTRSRRKKGS